MVGKVISNDGGEGAWYAKRGLAVAERRGRTQRKRFRRTEDDGTILLES